MQQLQDRITAKLQEPEAAAAWKAATGGTPEECPPIYSFDNPSIHLNNTTYLRELGLMEGSAPTDAWLQLPTYSGDLHRTIERVHARVCRQFQTWLDDASQDRTMADYCQTLCDIFFSTQTAAQIHSCMWPQHTPSLLALYKHVVETAGDKAARPYC